MSHKSVFSIATCLPVHQLHAMQADINERLAADHDLVQSPAESQPMPAEAGLTEQEPATLSGLSMNKGRRA